MTSDETPATKLSDADWERMRARLIELLLLHDRNAACVMIVDAVRDGLPFTDVYLMLLQPVLYRIGDLWESGSLDVAQEHYATAVIEMVLAQISPAIFRGHRRGPSMVAAAVEGNLHAVGVRMIADFFEADGWDSCYLGANVPASAIVAESIRRKAKLIALSASRDEQMPEVIQTIAAIRESTQLENPFVMVGGALFNALPNAIAGTGADAYAADARQAIEVAHGLMQSAEGAPGR